MARWKLLQISVNFGFTHVGPFVSTDTEQLALHRLTLLTVLVNHRGEPMVSVPVHASKRVRDESPVTQRPGSLSNKSRTSS